MNSAASPEHAIDRLYQLPLDQFVAARTAAAREARGSDAAAIRALQKPNQIAWALNQLFWREKPTFQRLVAAAAKLRSAQADALMAKANDLRTADAEHREAARAALAETTRILEEAGHAATPDTIRALTAAFEALPWPEPAGRLVRPPAAPGFGVFAGLPLAPSERVATSRPSAKPEVPSARAGRVVIRKAGANHGAERARADRRERDAQLKAARQSLGAARHASSAAAARLRTTEARLEKLRAAERHAREQLDAARTALQAAEAEQRQAAAGDTASRAGLQAAQEAVARLERDR